MGRDGLEWSPDHRPSSQDLQLKIKNVTENTITTIFFSSIVQNVGIWHLSLFGNFLKILPFFYFVLKICQFLPFYSNPLFKKIFVFNINRLDCSLPDKHMLNRNKGWISLSVDINNLKILIRLRRVQFLGIVCWYT